jgi:hypothetical protein
MCTKLAFLLLFPTKWASRFRIFLLFFYFSITFYVRLGSKPGAETGSECIQTGSDSIPVPMRQNVAVPAALVPPPPKKNINDEPFQF